MHCVLTMVGVSPEDAVTGWQRAVSVPPAILCNYNKFCDEIKHLANATTCTIHIGHDYRMLEQQALCVAVHAARWCVAAHDFLRSCGDAGNPDANYLLSMVRA